MKKSGIIYLDGIVCAKRTKKGYTIEVLNAGLEPGPSLHAAAEVISRDVTPPLLRMGETSGAGGLHAA